MLDASYRCAATYTHPHGMHPQCALAHLRLRCRDVAVLLDGGEDERAHRLIYQLAQLGGGVMVVAVDARAPGLLQRVHADTAAEGERRRRGAGGHLSRPVSGLC